MFEIIGKAIIFLSINAALLYGMIVGANKINEMVEEVENNNFPQRISPPQ